MPTPIVTAADLTLFLRYPQDEQITTTAAALAEKVATGWLSEATGTFPDPLPSPIYSWLIELAGIAYENPTSMESDTSQDTSSSWVDRRLQILANARQWRADRDAEADAASQVPAKSRGCFPPAQAWPA